MKFRLLLFFSLFQSFASANIVTCELENPGSVDIEQIVIRHNTKQIETIDYTATDKFENLYSRTISKPNIRGGFEVGSCNPDDNQVSEITGFIKAYSNCLITGTGEPVYFHFHMDPTTKAGKISIVALLNSGVFERSGNFKSCK